MGPINRLRNKIASDQRISKAVREVLAHPAGPLTIHFWAPAWKWGIVLAGLMDIHQPVEDVSIPQNIALAATGIIWSRYATQIKPKNYNLLSVNVFVGMTGIYQLYRVGFAQSSEDKQEKFDSP